MSLSVPSSRLVLDFRQSSSALVIKPLINILAWRGDPLLVPLSLWDQNAVADLTTTASITLLVKETADADDNTALMSDTKSVFTSDDGLGAGSCCIFDFTSSECNLAASLWAKAKTSIDLFVYLYAIGDDGEKREIASGTLSMYWDGNPTDVGTPDANPGIVIVNQRGVISIDSGATDGTLTFADAFSTAPAQVLLTLQRPSGGAWIWPMVTGTPTTTGFAWELSGATPDANHKIHWIAFQ